MPGVTPGRSHTDLRVIFHTVAAQTPGWHPYRITGTNQWGAEFEGDTSTLPDELVGLYILITAKSKYGKSWGAPVSKVLERTDRLARVRTKRT